MMSEILIRPASISDLTVLLRFEQGLILAEHPFEDGIKQMWLKIKNWSGETGSGTVTVSKVNGFLYFKCRNVILKANGMDNEGNFKQALKIGVEGAVKM